MGLSCFHCGHRPSQLKIDGIAIVVALAVTMAIGATIARFLA